MSFSLLGGVPRRIFISHAARSSEFWKSALGRTGRQGTIHPEFEVLDGRFNGVTGIVQRVADGPAGVHLDVHTDDVDAEVARLVGLGASEIARHGGWVVLTDPSGIAFCVVPVAGDDPVLDGAPVFDA